LRSSFPCHRFFGGCAARIHATSMCGSTLGSYLRDALQEGSADAVVCLPVPRA
jgi:uncharacterized protein YhdP